MSSYAQFVKDNIKKAPQGSSADRFRFVGQLWKQKKAEAKAAGASDAEVRTKEYASKTIDPAAVKAATSKKPDVSQHSMGDEDGDGIERVGAELDRATPGAPPSHSGAPPAKKSGYHQVRIDGGSLKKAGDGMQATVGLPDTSHLDAHRAPAQHRPLYHGYFLGANQF